MAGDVQTLLADAGQALLAGHLNEAQAHYQASLAQFPQMAALGLAVTAWSRGDYRGLRALADHAASISQQLDGFPHGLMSALEGLALIHLGDIHAGLARQRAGLEQARAQGDGAELNVLMAIAEAHLVLGRWTEALATVALVRPLVAPSAPLAAMMLERLSVALLVLTWAPDAGTNAAAAVRAARERHDEAGLAWCLRWQGAWLAIHAPDDAATVLAEAVELALSSGQHGVAAEALTLLAVHGAPALRVERLVGATAEARKSGSLMVEMDVALQSGGQKTRDAIRSFEKWLAPLDDAERAAFISWPGRDVGVQSAHSGDASLQRLGAVLTSIAAQTELRDLLQTALAAFVHNADAQRGYLLRLSGFEVIDQVVFGSAPDAYSTSLAGRVMWSGEALVIEDLESDTELGLAKSVQEMGLRMAIGMPMMSGGEVVGVMLADSREPHAGFGSDTLVIARAIADFVVVAWQNAERAVRLRDSEAAEAALGRAALVATGAATLAEALRAIAIEAALTLGVSRLFVHLGPDFELVAALDPHGQPLAHINTSLAAVRWVAEQGLPLIVVDVHDGVADGDRPPLPDDALRAIHAAPIPIAGQSSGVLFMDSPKPTFENRDARRIVEGLAAIIGAWLSRAGH